jgi:hypothetical protein
MQVVPLVPALSGPSSSPAQAANRGQALLAQQQQQCHTGGVQELLHCSLWLAFWRRTVSHWRVLTPTSQQTQQAGQQQAGAQVGWVLLVVSPWGLH